MVICARNHHRGVVIVDQVSIVVPTVRTERQAGKLHRYNLKKNAITYVPTWMRMYKVCRYHLQSYGTQRETRPGTIQKILARGCEAKLSACLIFGSDACPS